MTSAPVTWGCLPSSFLKDMGVEWSSTLKWKLWTISFLDPTYSTELISWLQKPLSSKFPVFGFPGLWSLCTFRAVIRHSNTNQGWFTKSSQWEAAAGRVTEPRGVCLLLSWGPVQAPQVHYLLANCQVSLVVSCFWDRVSWCSPGWPW